MGTVSRGVKAGGGTDYNAGQLIDPTEVNADTNTLYTLANGNIDDANVATAKLPGAKSLRFTKIADPSGPSANDALLYANDQGGLTTLAYNDSTTLASVPYYIRQVTEASTATGSAANIKTVTVNIPITATFRVGWSIRKSAGAAAAPTIGLLVSGIQVFANTAAFSAVNQAEAGSCWTSWIMPRGTNYLQGNGWLTLENSFSSLNTVVHSSTNFPNATITTLTISGSSVSASITLSVANVFVEILP